MEFDRPLVQISSRRDLEQWVSIHLAPDSDEEVGVLATRIQAMDHPPYGSDWCPFLDRLFPEDSWIEAKAQLLGVSE